MSSDDETRGSPVGSGPRQGLASGTRLGGHQIEAEIGRGGMGVVYRARHMALGRERALKVMAPGLSTDAHFKERFRRESRLAASIDHPNLIPVYDAGEDDGQLYISMRLVQGRSLQQEVEERGPVAPGRAVEIIRQASAALDASHAAGLVHRDIKPANILLEGDHVFVTDFGISRGGEARDPLTSTGQILGSPDYVAPEQADRGQAVPASDIYSLGGVLHYALTGKPPFERDGELAKLYAQAHAPRPKPSRTADWLTDAADLVVANAMAVDPAERYSSGSELAEAAATALAGLRGPPTDSGTPATRPLDRPERPGRRRWPVALAAAGCLLAVAVAVIALLGGGEDQTPPADSPAPASAGRVVATIDVGSEPNGVAIGEGGGLAGVWVGSRGAETVYRIDPATDKARPASAEIPGGPTSVATGFGSVWAVNGPGNRVVRLDPDGTGPPVDVPVGTNPSDVAVDDRWVWVANEDDDTVARIDPTTNAVDDTVPVGDSPRAIATGEGAVWTTNIEGQSVSRIDPDTAETVGRPTAVGQRPNDIAVGEGGVWVIDYFEGTLRRIDPDTRRAGEPIQITPKPRGVKTGFGSLWISSDAKNLLTRIDPRSGTPIGEPISVGEEPSDIGVGAGSVWTADLAGSTVTRVDPR